MTGPAAGIATAASSAGAPGAPSRSAAASSRARPRGSDRIQASTRLRQASVCGHALIAPPATRAAAEVHPGHPGENPACTRTSARTCQRRDGPSGRASVTAAGATSTAGPTKSPSAAPPGAAGGNGILASSVAHQGASAATRTSRVNRTTPSQQTEASCDSGRAPTNTPCVQAPSHRAHTAAPKAAHGRDHFLPLHRR